MKTFDFIQATISHHLKDPHSKALEPDCLSPRVPITTRSLKGEGNGENVERREAKNRSLQYEPEDMQDNVRV